MAGSEAHPDLLTEWPTNKVYACLQEIWEDGVVDDRERRRLASILTGVTGQNIGAYGTSASAELFNDPLPRLTFNQRVFVFTGPFAFGTREICWREILQLGGTTRKTITRKTDYLVIGKLASREWKHGSFGRKIQKAIRYRDRFGKLVIVPEDHWALNL